MSSGSPRIAVLMPAFNEQERLARTVQELASVSDRAELTVFLVDDGSERPIDAGAVRCVAAGLRVVLTRHVVNLGQGAAIETARRLALDPRWAPGAGATFDAYVTMDADGQHRAEDVLAVAGAVLGGADVALGDRFAGGSNVPTSRRALLALARRFERATTGIALSDAHNGLRAFSHRAIAGLRLRQNRMAHATEITRLVARASRPQAEAGSRGLVVVEVPVSVRYSAESLAKGQRASGAVGIVTDLVHGFLFGD